MSERMSCDCGAIVDADQAWTCTHRVHGTGLVCGQACCTQCHDDPCLILSCCDDHLLDAIRRTVKLDEWHLDTLSQAFEILRDRKQAPHCFSCEDSGERPGGSTCSCHTGRAKAEALKSVSSADSGGAAAQVSVRVSHFSDEDMPF